MTDKKIFTDEGGNRYEVHGTMPPDSNDMYLIKPVAAEPEHWRPQESKVYWYVKRDGQVASTSYFQRLADDEQSVRIGNVFKSEDDARSAAAAVCALFGVVHAHEPEAAALIEELLANIEAAHDVIYHGYREDGDGA